MRRINRILVAIKDPRAQSTPALLKAAQLARATGAELELFHGISTPLFVDGYGVSRKDLPAVQEAERAKVVQLLVKMSARLGQPHTKTSVATEWDYPAYEAIVRR